MTRQAWILVGVIAVIAIGTGYFVRSKTSQTDSAAAANSQLPSDDAEANYAVPPSVGVSENAPTQVYGDNTTYSMSMGNSLPLSFGPK